MLTAIRVTVEFHWGYSIKRPFFSASQPALAVPPPTALIGALARAAAAVNGWPEVEEAQNDAKKTPQESKAHRSGGAVKKAQRAGSTRGSVGYRLYSGAVRVLGEVPWASLALADVRFVSPLIGLVETRDIIKVLIAPYQRGANVSPDSANIFGVQPHGKVFAPSMRAHVLYLAKSEKSKEAKEWAYALQSIGSKESIVSAVDVEVGEARVRDATGRVQTCYYFPVRLGEVADSAGFIREVLSLPTREHFLLGAVHGLEGWEEFLIPLGRVSVRPTEEAALVEDPSGEVALVPRGVMEHV